MNGGDPFRVLLKREARFHFFACLMAFLALVASRYVAGREAGPHAILLTPSPVGLIADFVSAVLILTFFRVLYGIPLSLTRPSIQRVGRYVLFTLVFGTLFTLRTQQGIGVQMEDGGVRVFYPSPRSSQVIPLAKLVGPTLRETSAVSIVELTDPPTEFVPAFRFDSLGQSRLLALFQALQKAR